jgi:hypothetical protein
VGRDALLDLLFPQLSSVQDNHYTKMAYCRVLSSNPLQNEHAQVNKQPHQKKKRRRRRRRKKERRNKQERKKGEKRNKGLLHIRKN